MPIMKAAVKALRQSTKRRSVNRGMKDRYKTAIKDVIKLVQQKKYDEAAKKMPEVMSFIDKAAKDNLIHQNNAANKKSRLARMLATK